MIFDIRFREWFIEVYLDEMCNMLMDTLHCFTVTEDGEDISQSYQEHKKKQKAMLQKTESIARSITNQYMQRLLGEQGNENFVLPDDPNVRNQYNLIFHQILNGMFWIFL